MSHTVTPSHFVSHGIDCAGKLFLPDNIERPPVVVMGHGLGAQQDFRLPAFAQRFATLSCYRGASETEFCSYQSNIFAIFVSFYEPLYPPGWRSKSPASNSLTPPPTSPTRPPLVCEG